MRIFLGVPEVIKHILNPSNFYEFLIHPITNVWPTDRLSKKKITCENFFRGSWGPKTHFKHIKFLMNFFNPPHYKCVTNWVKRKNYSWKFFRGSWGPKTHFKHIKFLMNFLTHPITNVWPTERLSKKKITCENFFWDLLRF